MGDAFCLKWNNHQTTLVSVFDKLFECESLVDCTLAAEGRQLKAHKVVLSACSPYLEELIRNHDDKHPIIIFNSIRFDELRAMLEYMYRGEVNVSQEQLDSFLKVAESLKIRGLTDQGGGTKGSDDDDKGTPKKRRRRGSSESSEDKESRGEPKVEPAEEPKSEPAEDLTLEEDEEDYGGPGPGTSQGSFSSQDFNNWQVSGDITSDEVFMAAQQEINNQHPNTNQEMDTYLSGKRRRIKGASSSTRTSKKKRNWTKVVRKFHENWQLQFVVMEVNEKAVCILCNKNFTNNKVYNIRNHFQHMHSEFDIQYPLGSPSRIEEINRLMSTFNQWRS